MLGDDEIPLREKIGWLCAKMVVLEVKVFGIGWSSCCLLPKNHEIEKTILEVDEYF